MDAMQAVAKVNEERLAIRRKIEAGLQRVLDEIGPIPFHVTVSVDEADVTGVEDVVPRYALRARVDVILPFRDIFEDGT